MRGLSTLFLRPIVRALVEEIPAPSRVDGPEPENAAYHYTVRALSVAPWHIRAAELVARPALWFWLIAGGSPTSFARLGGPFASFTRLYRSLALMAYFETSEARAAVGGETIPQRQTRHRALREAALRDEPS